MKYCVIGFGGRGKLYSDYFAKLGAAVTAVCDKDRKRLEYARQIHGLSPDMLFDEARFSAAASWQTCAWCHAGLQHKEHAGNHESGLRPSPRKPIATTLEDCLKYRMLPEAEQEGVRLRAALRPLLRGDKE